MIVKMEHVLILLIAAFVIYHLVDRCGCTNGLVGVDGIDGFSVGIETSSTIPSNCTTTLNNLCSASRQEGSEKCGVCVENNEHNLLEAGCTASMVDSFCWNNLPPCPLTENPDDVMFPFSYNPNCREKFDEHVYSKQYTFDGKDYYICKGLNKFDQKCRPTEGQIIPPCKKEFANNCDEFKSYDGKECNNKYQFSEEIIGDGTTIKKKVNCNNFRLYGTQIPFECFSKKDSGVLDKNCAKIKCNTEAGPNRQNVYDNNWCYE